MQLCRDTKGVAESLAERHGIGLTEKAEIKWKQYQKTYTSV